VAVLALPWRYRTVKSRMDDGSIASPDEFVADMKLIFQV
jgi:hypothetical protein